MHSHAEHSLFFEQRQPLWRSASALGLTLTVIVINAGASSTTISLLGTGLALLLLLLAYVRGQSRVEPVFAWTLALVLSTLLAGAALGGERARFVETAARVSCGVFWVLWLGTQLDWASLRQLLITARLPESIVSALDHAVMHGFLTQREWTRRRDAARLRLGSARLPLRTWGQLLGEGAMSGFIRMESVEEHGLLRSSLSSKASGPQGVLLDSVRVERSGQPVLQDIHLSVAAGEWVLLCGPSGAGKTSLMRLLAGLDEPAHGSMERLGSVLRPGASLRERLDGGVALLTQNPEHHFIASTVIEDICWGLLRRGVEAKAAHQRAEELAQALGVGQLLERPCHALSFGEQRRVALAGLLVLEPALLLLDEPTAGLDPVAAHELRMLVEDFVKRKGAACIWASHDLHSLPPSAERVVLLQDGRVIFDGDSSEGLSRPWLLRAGLAVPQREEESIGSKAGGRDWR